MYYVCMCNGNGDVRLATASSAAVLQGLYLARNVLFHFFESGEIEMFRAALNAHIQKASEFDN